jgi:enolase-phosphatase E1
VHVKAIVCDIEGTTSSISFVHRVLFPLSLEALPGFLRDHAQHADVAKELEAFCRQIGASGPDREKVALETLQEYIRKDVKDTTLKWIQGKIWKQAFETGSIRGHVYREVPGYLRAWKDRGCRIYIYSSGSVEAQRLMFRHSEAGDLSEYLDGYFDTTTGGKREAASYRKIAEAVDVAPGEIVFLSDVAEELAAAEASGFQTCLLLREGAQAPQHFAGRTATDFAEVNAYFF